MFEYYAKYTDICLDILHHWSCLVHKIRVYIANQILRTHLTMQFKFTTIQQEKEQKV